MVSQRMNRWTEGSTKWRTVIQRRGVVVRQLLYVCLWSLFFYHLILHDWVQAAADRLPQIQTTTQETQRTTQTALGTVVDITEDPKAMGYPDGRKVVRDEFGHLYVAYRKKYKLHQSTSYHIFVAKSKDNGRSWQVLNQGQPIEAVGDQNQRVPAIAIDRQGIIHVVWYGKDDSPTDRRENQIKYVRSADYGQSWTAWRNIAYVDDYAGQAMWQEHPAIYVDATDTLYVVWEGYDIKYRAKTQIKFLRSEDGGDSWSVWQNVAPSSINHSRPTIVGDRQTTLYILAYATMGGRQQIVFSHSTDGGSTWEQWQRIAPSVMEQRHVSAAVDSSGRLHVVWQQQPFTWRSLIPSLTGGSDTEIHYATYEDGAWRVPEAIPAGDGGAQTFPTIRLDAAEDDAGSNSHDRVWVAWSESDKTAIPDATLTVGNRIYATMKTNNGWLEPRAITSTGDQSYPSFARTSINSADLVWLSNDRSKNQIYFAQLTASQLLLDRDSVAAARSIGLQSIQPDLLPATSIQKMAISSNAHLWFLQWVWGWQLTREVQTLLFILLMLVGYMLLKFVAARWFTTTTDG